MNLPLNLTPQIALQGTAGTYLLFAESESGNRLFLNTSVVGGLGRKDGQTYNAYSLMLRMLFSGDDPVSAEGIELRDKKPYKKVGEPNGDDYYAQQLNKLLFPIATTNIGSEGLLKQLDFHFAALDDLLSPFMEANKLQVKQPMSVIFEAQNPALFVPAILFSPPSTLQTWDETVKGLKEIQNAKYQPKNPGYKEGGAA